MVRWCKTNREFPVLPRPGAREVKRRWKAVVGVNTFVVRLAILVAVSNRERHSCEVTADEMVQGNHV